MVRRLIVPFLLVASAALAQQVDGQVQKLVQDTVKGYEGAACEFEFDIAANILDPKNTTYAKGTGYLGGPERCHAKLKVTDGAGKSTEVEWFESSGVAAARVGDGPWQKVGLAPRREDEALFHWLSLVQVFKEIEGTSAYFAERSGQGEEGKSTELALDLSPMLQTYYTRFKLDPAANDPKGAPQTSATVKIDNEQKRFLEIGYSVIIPQKRAAAAGKDADPGALEDDDGGQGPMDPCGKSGPKPRLKAGEETINYGYQAKFVFKYPANLKKPQAPKEAAALVNW